ncbi:hypothetical protein CRI93_06835 [Longimonas halophila]|uniref:6-bladed beta-propeller n=2 Tax=Longimonas halophila TaxID=1469170 RepID=A0A2H3P617_9BACT|nr:hypothetical protein CRI93_06835 [Longimonas halophila]
MRITYFIVLFVLFSILPEAYAQELTDVINWTGEITLEENEEVLTDRVNVRVEDNRFLISDTRENQVREYARDGTLLNYFGADDPQAPGGGWFPSTPLRMSEDTILVPNKGNGSLSLVDENGNPLERHTHIAKSGDFDVASLPVDGHVLFVGSANGRQGTPNFLHHLDPSSGEVTKSFYPLPGAFGSHAGFLYDISPIVRVDVYAGKIAVGFLFSNNITLLDIDGTLLDEIEPTLSSFKKVEQTEEMPARDEWEEELARRSLSNTLYWLNGETLLVQFTNSYFDDQGERQLNRVLAAVTTEGEVLFEIEDTPRLLAVDQETGDLFFAHPDHDFESHWRVGQVKEEVLP